MTTPLRDTDHPYYCSEGNYFVAGTRWYEVHQEFDTWADFYEEWGYSDVDFNLLFRWDWNTIDPEDYKYMKDGEYRGDTLELFFMGQRKARNNSVFVKVTEADEPAVREFLAERAKTMAAIWEPFISLKEE